MRLALASFGSRGDVAPFAALAAALRAAGHEAWVCAPADHAPLAAAAGVPFRPVTADFDRRLKELRGRLDLLLVRMRIAVREQFAELPAALDGADAVVATGGLLAARTLAEARGLPYRYVAFSPRVIRSRDHAAPGVPGGPLAPWLHRLTWRLNDAAWNAVAGGIVNRERRRLGLPPVRSVFDHVISDRPLLAADPLLARLPPDAPLGADQTGAWPPPPGPPLPDDVERFLAGGAPPVYVGFGSMGDEPPGSTARLVVEALRAAGVRAIVSRSIPGLDRQDLPPGVLPVGELDHARLFPRLAAVVHHGGAGTTHAAARAGVPQVVVPHLLDQHDWARRVHRLGLGPPPLPRRRLDVRRLAAAVLECVGRPEWSATARDLAPRLRTDGLEHAVALLARR